jgi:peptide/nickel transport system substrate-binding protein
MLCGAMSVVIAAGCVACSASPDGTSGAGRGEKRLVWGKPAEADLLDPTLAGSGTASELLNLTYERLVDLDGNLKIVPRLAESWRQTSPTTYDFTLRQGVKFSNGRAMTAADVTGTFDRVVDPKIGSLWASQLGIRSVTSSDEAHVTFTLTQPRTSFLAALAASRAAILPMKELRADTFDPKKQLLGTGPFKVVAHSQGESWSLVRNPYYWQRGLPKVDKLTIRIMPDDAARTAALRDGTIDVTTYENPDAIRLLKGQAGIATKVQSTTDFYRLDVNAKSSVFRDERLRQALALSIDRDAISRLVLAGVGRPTAAVSPVFAGICDPATVPFAKPDAGRARQLVQAAGAAGKTVGIMTIPQSPMATPIAQLIQRSLQSAGLKVHIDRVDIGEATKRAYIGKTADFDLSVGWLFGYADPGMVVTWWNPDLAAFTKAWMVSDGQMNTLIKQGTTAVGATRTQTLHSICDRVAQNANMIPLVSKDAIIAYRADKIAPSIPPVEGYGVPLRHIAEFQLK